MKDPLVSVLIINWNGGSVFENCLKSLKQLSYSNWELIVVDNGSSDKSLSLVSKYFSKAKIIKNARNLGFAKANNQALEKADGEFILLLNNDTKVQKNLLTVLVDKMQSDQAIGILQPKIYMMDKPGYLDNAGSFFTDIGFLEHWGFGKKDSSEFSKERSVFAAKGACLFFRKKVTETLGLFDDDFTSYFEESDFCWRAWLLGYKVIFYPKTWIQHKVGFTIKRLDVGNINFHYYKNRIASLIKNLSTSRLILILPVHLLISLGISVAFLLRGSISSSLMILKAIYWNLSNLSKVLKKRSQVQKARVLADQEIFSGLKKPVNLTKFYNDFKRVEKDIRNKSET